MLDPSGPWQRAQIVQARPFITSDWLICDQGQGRATIFQRFFVCFFLHPPALINYEKGSTFCTHISEICIFVWSCRRSAFERGEEGLFGRSLYLYSFERRLMQGCPQRHHQSSSILISLSFGTFLLPTFTPFTSFFWLYLRRVTTQWKGVFRNEKIPPPP